MHRSVRSQSFTQPHPSIRPSCKAQNRHRTIEAIGSTLTHVKTETYRGQWFKGVLGQSGTKASWRACLLTSQ